MEKSEIKNETVYEITVYEIVRDIRTQTEELLAMVQDLHKPFAGMIKEEPNTFEGTLDTSKEDTRTNKEIAEDEADYERNEQHAQDNK